MATLTITKEWANGEILLESDLDFIKNDVETFLNVTGIDDDNIQDVGITASSKLVDGSISTAKLAGSSVTAPKIASDAVTTIKILDANVTVAKLGPDVALAFTPPSTVWDFAGSSAPTGWLLCDGSAISRTTYAALFTAVGTTYGVGNGTTTFNIPDCRGRVSVGKDDMGGSSANRMTLAGSGITGTTLGSAGGEETHVMLNAEMPNHRHAISFTSQPPSTLTTVQGGGIIDVASSTHTHTITGNSNGVTAISSGAAHQNTQPSIIFNRIIKT